MNKFKQKNHFPLSSKEELTSRQIPCITIIIGYLKSYLCQFILSCVSWSMLKQSQSKDSFSCSKKGEIFALILLISSGCLLILSCVYLVKYLLKNVFDLKTLQFWNTLFLWMVVMYVGIKTIAGSAQECIPLNTINKGVFYCVVLHAFEKFAVTSSSSQFWQRQISSNSSCVFAFVLLTSNFSSSIDSSSNVNEQFLVINTLNILNISSFVLHTGLNILVNQQSKELQTHVFTASYVLTTFAYLANLPGLIQLVFKINNIEDTSQQMFSTNQLQLQQQYNQFSMLAGYSQLLMIPITIILSRVIQASFESKQHDHLLDSLPIQESASLLRRNQYDFVDEGVHIRKDVLEEKDEDEDIEEQWISTNNNSQRKLSNQWKPLSPPILD